MGLFSWKPFAAVLVALPAWAINPVLVSNPTNQHWRLVSGPLYYGLRVQITVDHEKAPVTRHYFYPAPDEKILRLLYKAYPPGEQGVHEARYRSRYQVLLDLPPGSLTRIELDQPSADARAVFHVLDHNGIISDWFDGEITYVVDNRKAVRRDSYIGLKYKWDGKSRQDPDLKSGVIDGLPGLTFRLPEWSGRIPHLF